MTPRISVGIPTYNGAEKLLPWCLEAIASRSGNRDQYELIVVDDSGRHEHRVRTKEIAERYGAKWLYHEHNKGIPAGWNALTRAASTPRIVLLNDDIVVVPNWIEAIAYFLENNDHAGTCGMHFNFLVESDVPTLVADPAAPMPCRDPHTKAPKTFDHNPNGEPGVMMCPVGCCFGFNRDKFDLVGGFDECFTSFYEESDFSTALASRGMPSYGLPWPTLGHIWSATFNSAPELNAGARMTASRARYVEKWGGDFSYTDPLFMARCTPKLTKWLGPDGQPREAMR